MAKKNQALSWAGRLSFWMGMQIESWNQEEDYSTDRFFHSLN